MKKIDKKLNKIKELYDKSPIVINHELDYIISKYGKKDDSEKLKKNIFTIFAILCMLLGFVNIFNSDTTYIIENIGLYYSGVIFFLPGLLVALSFNKSGLVFLFSHGGLGLGLMLTSIISSSELEIYLSDNPTMLLFYLRIINIAIILAVILTVLYNLNDRLKDNIKFYFLIFILYLLAIAMVVFLPNLLPYLI